MKTGRLHLKQQHKVLLVSAALVLVAVAAALLSRAGSAQMLRLTDIRSEQSLAGFVGGWLAENAGNLRYGASTIDAEECEIAVLTVTEEAPYAAIYFRVTATAEVDGTGYADCIAVFEAYGDGGMYRYTTGSTHTGISRQTFTGEGFLTTGLRDWLYVAAFDNSSLGASAYNFKYNGEEYSGDIDGSGYVLDINVLPYGTSTEVTDVYLLDEAGNAVEQVY